MYCLDVQGLMNHLKPNVCKPNKWRIFMDSLKRSLKAVLLHNGNEYACVPITHSTKLKESYENMKYVLEKIKYTEHKWQVCRNLKIIFIILGQQSGFVKYSCFLCLWDSRDCQNHYWKKEWPRSYSRTIARSIKNPAFSTSHKT